MVPVAKGKTRITIRLDDEVLDWFRARVEAAGGGNYQTLINDTLRQIIGSVREPLGDGRTPRGPGRTSPPTDPSEGHPPYVGGITSICS